MTTQPNTKCTCPSGDGSLRWPCPKHSPAAAQEAVVWQWRCPRADTDWSDCDKSLYDELRKAIGGEAGEMNGLRYEVRALYAAPVTAAPGIDLAGKSGLLRRARSLFDQDREYALERGDSHHAGQCTKDIASIDALIDASPKGGSEAQPMFYIQDTRGFVGNCPMWWGPDGRGYVTRLDEAGRYTEEEAIQQNKARDTDIPWPCDEIDKLARPTVDFQHMRPRSERLAELVAQAGDAEVQP
ncbi:hypothetical protein [Stenotrophomonas acidaminiphila]|uniref:hypothetical protein n=1 Tax=Stenotrophomonas acidaminiphila TaxID=128780 RepID=UPI0028AD5B82|nr:hypothetical protein [Stenotrophomonas acidaminiphila]